MTRTESSSNPSRSSIEGVAFFWPPPPGRSVLKVEFGEEFTELEAEEEEDRPLPSGELVLTSVSRLPRKAFVMFRKDSSISGRSERWRVE